MDHDPSRTSHYIGNEYYEKLIADFSGWQVDENEIADSGIRDACRRLLEKEARMLDEDRLDDWLGLYAAECVYWVPASLGGGDPRREIAISFDDRRRLEDRNFRLKNDYAWSQRPKPRTARTVSNVAVFKTDDEASLMVRSNFITTEFQAGDFRTYTGWSGHRLRIGQDGTYEILVKQVNLIDYDQNLRNPSITL
ncbi:MAG: aromatic-ring-hydroxylating dioxygenase subunit beta [Rhodospirillales bacterium]|nr:aromatic-ring-hydroxylating dioxygenase subunit beta [Rhodospirillales bacterium]